MKFTAQVRENSGKGVNRKLRAKGLNPGIVYGMGEPMMVSMRSDQALRLLQALHGTVKEIALEIEKDGQVVETKNVLIQDYQTSNYGNRVVHVDFREVDENTVIEVEVPVETTECDATKLGGLLQVIRHELPVRCAVKDIPESIEIDVKDLQIGKSVHVLDFAYPEGVKPVVSGRNFTVVTLTGSSASTEEEEEEAAE